MGVKPPRRGSILAPRFRMGWYNTSASPLCLNRHRVTLRKAPMLHSSLNLTLDSDTNRKVVESRKNVFENRKPHAYQTAKPLKSSWYRKFPLPKRTPRYWFWHVILHFFNCIVAFTQGLLWLIKNMTMCGERTLLVNVFYHEEGVRGSHVWYG
jgi:hypothetical protein